MKRVVVIAKSLPSDVDVILFLADMSAEKDLA
jgi:hypothetical protein